MKHILTIAITALLVVAANAQSKTINLKLNGRTVTGIDASSAFAVDVTRDNKSSAVAIIPNRYVDDFKYNIDSRGVLTIGFRFNTSISLKNGEQLRLILTCPELNDIEASSASKININSEFECRDLSIEVSSAARVNVNTNLTCRDLSIESSSAAKVQGSGKLTISGSSSIELSSASGVDLNIESKGDLSVEASSGAKVILKGSAASISVDVSSGAKADCGNLDVQKTRRSETSSGGSIILNR